MSPTASRASALRLSFLLLWRDLLARELNLKPVLVGASPNEKLCQTLFLINELFNLFCHDLTGRNAASTRPHIGIDAKYMFGFYGRNGLP